MPDFILKPDDQSPKAGLCTAFRLFPRWSSLRGRKQCQLPEGDYKQFKENQQSNN